MQSSDNAADLSSVCPSFSLYYSDDRISSAVSRAVAADQQQPSTSDEFGFTIQKFNDDEEDGNEGEFEFSILCDGEFPEGEIGEIFPIFDRDLTERETASSEVETASVTLGKLFIEERDDTHREEEDCGSSSSSEADELESVEPGTYCVWKPKKSAAEETPAISPSGCKKSKSTGSRSSKRWKLRDLLLRRSNSDGKDSFVFLTPSSSTSSSSKSENIVGDDVAARNSNNNNNNNPSLQKVKAVRRASADHKGTRVSAHETFYVKNRAVKEEDRKRSYLPYRKGLVGFGFFPNGMNVANNFRPF